jgi:hypothetical protein
VGVIHVGAVLAEREFVSKGLTGFDGLLIQPRDAIHPIGQQDPVPVHAGWLREAIGDVNPNTISIDSFDGRARRRTVVAPAFAAWKTFTPPITLYGSIHPLGVMTGV